MKSPDGPADGFSLLDEASLAPCFRVAFETREDAEQGLDMMKDIIGHCMWFDIPEVPAAPANPAWGKKWNQ